MADDKSTTEKTAAGTQAKATPPAAGMRRVRVTYDPSGFRGVADYPEAEAKLLVDEHRAHFVGDDVPTGEDVPEEPPAPTTGKRKR